MGFKYICLVSQLQTRTAYVGHGNFVHRLNGCRDDFLEIYQPEKRIAYNGHIC
jgi:hypothetical protein